MTTRCSGNKSLGLGLLIVHQLVTSHGGTVGVESTQGQGTVFTLKLPRQLKEAPRLPQTG